MKIHVKTISSDATLSSVNQERALSQNLSTLDVWSLALGCIIGWGAFVMPGTTFLIRGGTIGTLLAIILGAIIMVVIALNYHFMVTRYPFAGGGFTYANKEFGKVHAHICGWFLALAYLSVVPMNATALALLGRNLTGSLFQFGFHYSFAEYDVYCGELLLAISVLVFFGIVNIKGGRDSGAWQTLLIAALIVGVAVFIIAALVRTDASWSHVVTPTFPENTTKLASILSVLAITPWAFFGFDTIPQAAEEYNFSNKKTLRLMVLSIILGGFIYISLNTLTASVVPPSYATYMDYIRDLPNTKGIQSLPTFNAAYQLLGTLGIILLGIAVLGAILSGINGFYLATSRLLYSMARDGALPKWFARLSQKGKTPYNAIIFVMLVSMIAPFFGRTALGWIVDMSSIGAAVSFGYTSAASFKKAKREKCYLIVFSSILGVFFSIVFIMLLLVPTQTFRCSLSKESVICLAVWIVLGIFFHISYYYRKAGK